MVTRVLRILLAILAATAITFGGITLVRDLNGSASRPSVTGKGPTTEKDDDFGTVKIYSVDEQGDLDPAASGLTAHVWDYFRRVITPAFAAEIMLQYRAGDAPKSDTLAYVYQDDDPQYWILAANLATSKNDADLIATLVHEYSHILTLDTSQFTVDAASCDTLDLSEGCANADSYLQVFEDTFWSNYSDAPSAENTDEDIAYNFYLAHEDDFVSDYAATNVVEDTAESFMTFVLEDHPKGNSLIAQKLDFFWHYPELVTIRERIRTEFQDELGLAN